MTGMQFRQAARTATILVAGATVLAAAGLATAGAAETPSSPAAPAAAPAEPAKANPSKSTEDCMFSVVVKDWAAIDNQSFIIYGLSRHEAFLAKVLYPTPDLINNLGLVVIDEDHNGRICGRYTDAIEFRNPTIPGRNPITSLRKITAEEAKSLLAASKHKPAVPKSPKDEKAAKDSGPPQ